MVGAEVAAGGVDTLRPRVVDERRMEHRALDPPLAEADDRFGEVGARGRAVDGHRAGTGLRTGGRSRSGTSRGAGGAAGRTCAGSRTGSTTIRRDGPGKDAAGSERGACGMTITFDGSIPS
jgi:hypothetical protein